MGYIYLPNAKLDSHRLQAARQSLALAAATQLAGFIQLLLRATSPMPAALPAVRSGTSFRIAAGNFPHS